jgi:type III pantothenate kinase
MYPGLGIDRALAVWGAGNKCHFPCLVVDGGTALTFTGVSYDRTLVGGAILPGLGLQLQSLARHTAALPQVALGLSLPDRWAISTPEAIVSGTIYTILAGVRDFLEDWLDRFPNSSIVFTGGDGKLLSELLGEKFPIIFDRHLIFWGMQMIISLCGSQKSNVKSQK